jgi:hypothetical protein
MLTPWWWLKSRTVSAEQAVAELAALAWRCRAGARKQSIPNIAQPSTTQGSVDR